MTGLVVTGFIGLAALVWQITDFMKELTNLPGNWRAVLTQSLAWAAGVVGVFLYGASQFAATVTIGDVSMADMDGPTKVLIGLMVAAVGSSLVDWKKARDNNDSGAAPTLLPPKGPNP